MNEITEILSVFENQLKSNTPCHKIQQLRDWNRQTVCEISPVGEQTYMIARICQRAKSEVQNEDESNESEDGDDELPCVIGGGSKQKTVCDEACEVDSIDKVQLTSLPAAKSNHAGQCTTYDNPNRS